MEHNFVDAICKGFDLPKPDATSYSPLELAYLGDCVYEAVIRTVVCYRRKTSVKNLNNSSVSYARATYQATLADNLVKGDLLSEEELAIYKRGRNSSPSSKARSATRAEYMKATGLETLIGWLYMREEYDRIIEIIRQGSEDGI